MLIDLDVLIDIFAAYQTVEQQIAKGCDDNPVTRLETCNVGHQTLDNGKMPPPHTNTMNRPEAAARYLPNPSTAKLKIPPHMMEVHRPTSTRYIALMGTSANPKERPPVALCWSTGRLTSER